MAKDHPSVEDVYKRVKAKIPPISFDTVYRSLALFERKGVITMMRRLDDRTRYKPKPPNIITFFWLSVRKYRQKRGKRLEVGASYFFSFRIE